MELTPTVLTGRFARLEPLAEAHREPLRAAVDADPDIWRFYPYSMAGEHFDGWWTHVAAERTAGRWLPFVVMAGEDCVGCSSLIAPDSENASVEIGGTYYRPEARGGAVNPQAKRLLLSHAFQAGARRVAFRVDVLNARSRAAMAKLGAVKEGVLRQDRRTWTGRVRDTVIFSILAAEWPGVRDRLDARLAAFG